MRGDWVIELTSTDRMPIVRRPALAATVGKNGITIIQKKRLLFAPLHQSNGHEAIQNLQERLLSTERRGRWTGVR